MALKAVVCTQIASFASELKVPSTTSRSEVVKLSMKKSFKTWWPAFITHCKSATSR